MIALLLVAAQAEAGVAAEVSAPIVCEVIEAALGARPELISKCGDVAVTIGPVDFYRSAANPDTGSVALVIERNGRSVVYVVRPSAKNGPFIEDVTLDLLKPLNRSSRAQLSGRTVDLDRYAADGVIGIASGNGGTEAGDFSAQISVFDIISAEQARLLTPSDPLPIVPVEPSGRGPG